MVASSFTVWVCLPFIVHMSLYLTNRIKLCLHREEAQAWAGDVWMMVCHRVLLPARPVQECSLETGFQNTIQSCPKVTKPSSFQRTRSLFQSLWFPLRSLKSGVANDGLRITVHPFPACSYEYYWTQLHSTLLLSMASSSQHDRLRGCNRNHRPPQILNIFHRTSQGPHFRCQPDSGVQHTTWTNRQTRTSSITCRAQCKMKCKALPAWEHYGISRLNSRRK